MENIKPDSKEPRARTNVEALHKVFLGEFAEGRDGRLIYESLVREGMDNHVASKLWAKSIERYFEEKS